MAWPRKPLPENRTADESALVGLDLNATRARAVRGPAELAPQPVSLEETQEELPMILSLEGRRPEVGCAGAALCRRSPHLTCFDFLAYLGERREWVAGRHRLDAAKAVSLVVQRFQAACTETKGLVLALPAYLSRAQMALVATAADKAKLPVLGSVRAPLAGAWTAYAVDPWVGLALVLDADEHALTTTMISSDGEQLTITRSESSSHLSLRAWKERLLAGVAERCVRQSRRDPRDSALAEQALYEQLEPALDACRQGRTVDLLIQTAHWYQNLVLRPEEMGSVCSGLVKQTLAQIQALIGQEMVRTVLLTCAVGRLPGLVAALEDYWHEQAPARPRDPSPDFGEGLLDQGDGTVAMAELATDALARAAHDLAARIQRGWLPRGHFDLLLPLPASDPQSVLASPHKRSFRILSADQ